MDSPKVVDKKVRSLLNKLTMKKLEFISNQIIAWANRSKNEKDGHTLIRVIGLVFEKATDEASLSEMYTRLCLKMMKMINQYVQDDGITTRKASLSLAVHHSASNFSIAARKNSSVVGRKRKLPLLLRSSKSLRRGHESCERCQQGGRRRKRSLL